MVEVKVGVADRDMTFSQALEALKRKFRLSREGWNGRGMWIKIQIPDENSYMTAPYIFMKTANKPDEVPEFNRVPWIASQTDLLANDWYIVK